MYRHDFSNYESTATREGHGLYTEKTSEGGIVKVLMLIGGFMALSLSIALVSGRSEQK